MFKHFIFLTNVYNILACAVFLLTINKCAHIHIQHAHTYVPSHTRRKEIVT